MAIVKLQLVEQARLQIGPALEARLLQRFADAAVEALYRAIRLPVARWREALLDHDAGARGVYVLLVFDLKLRHATAGGHDEQARVTNRRAYLSVSSLVAPRALRRG